MADADGAVDWPVNQVVLIAAATRGPATLAAALPQAVAALSPAALVILGGDAGARAAMVAALAGPAQAAGIAVLVADDPALAARAGLDGVHLTAASPEAVQRAAKGGRLQVGASAPVGRDLAMSLAEAGADYVLMGDPLAGEAADGEPPVPTDLLPLVDVLGWWAEMVVVPIVAAGWWRLDDLPPILAARPDFVAVPAALWADPAVTMRLAQQLAPAAAGHGA